MSLFNRSVATANLGSLQPSANGFSKNNSSNILSANIGLLQPLSQPPAAPTSLLQALQNNPQSGALQNPPKFGGIGQNPPKFGGIGDNTIGRRTIFDPKTQGDSYTLGGNTYKIGGTGYSTKVYQQSGDTWAPVTWNGTAPASLQLSAAIKDPRLASWLTTDDPSIKYDDLIRSTWAKDPTQALAVYGQQAARKPGGVDPTPDSAWFTDENYWPSVMAGFDSSTPALTQSVKELGTATPQNVAALNQWRSDMSPGAQHDRNDPDKGLFGGGLLGMVAPVALGFALGPAGLGLSGIGGGALAGGITSAVAGGNILKGAALGGLGGGLSNYASTNFSSAPSAGFAGISPAQLASTVGKTGISILGGASPTQALTGGLSSLAGTSAASNFDNPWLKNLAGTTASTAIRGGDIGNAAIGSLLGTTAKFGASQTDNPWLKQLALSSPGMIGQLMNNSQNTQQFGQRPQQAQPQQVQQGQMPPWVRQAMVALGKKGYSEAQARQMIQQRGRG